MKILVNPVFSWETCALESCERVYEHDGPVTQMKFGGGGKAPPPPDPNVVSAAQTRSNRDTAQYEAALNSGNVTTPLGSSRFTGRVDPTTGATVYDQTISLSPDAQAQLDQELAQNRQLNTIAGGMMTRIGDQYATPMDTSKLPGLMAGANVGQYQQGINTTGVSPLRGAPSMGQYQTDVSVNGPGLVGSIDTANLPELLGANDLEGARKAISDALYSRQSAYLDPQYQQREDATRTRLANQGITEGSEAWQRSMDEFSRDRAFNYDRAREAAITGSSGELARLAGVALGNRSQAFGERATGANFTNDARAQALAEALSTGNFRNSAVGAGNTDALRAAGFDNEVSNTQFDRAGQAGQFANAATAAGNADALRAAGFTNDARAQALQEALTLRNQPLNEFNALRSSSPVDIPQFEGAPDTGVNPTDVAGNIWNNYNANLNIWNARQQSRNSMLGGLMGLGGQLGAAAIPMMSDIRVKENIVRVGAFPSGLGVYEYNYIGDDPAHRHTGVIAQELREHDPEAVIDIDGILHVDYSRAARWS